MQSTKKIIIVIFILSIIFVSSIFIFIIAPNPLLNLNFVSDKKIYSESTFNGIHIIINLFAIISVIILIIQIELSKKANMISIYNQVYSDNNKIRKYHKKAHEQHKKLLKMLSVIENMKNRQDFDDFYSRDEYSELREIAFHFENLGYLVKTKN